MTLTVRLPAQIEQALEVHCAALRKTKSQVVTELIDNHLRGTQPRSKRPYLSARQVGLIGCYASSAPARTPAKAPDYKARVRKAIRAKHAR